MIRKTVCLIGGSSSGKTCFRKYLDAYFNKNKKYTITQKYYPSICVEITTINVNDMTISIWDADPDKIQPYHEGRDLAIAFYTAKTYQDTKKSIKDFKRNTSGKVPIIHVWNKLDLIRDQKMFDEKKALIPDLIPMSIKNNTGCLELLETMKLSLKSIEPVAINDPVPIINNNK
jgi:GTPase SAR1 family protein